MMHPRRTPQPRIVPRRAFSIAPLAAVLLCLSLLLPGCGGEPKTTTTVSLEIGGDCESCPTQRLDTLLARVAGVTNVRYDRATNELTLSFDSSFVKSPVLVALLNDAGYDAGESMTVLPSLIDKCCSVVSPLLDSLRRVDTLTLSPEQRANLMAMILNARNTDSRDLDLDNLDDDDANLLTDGTLDEAVDSELDGVLEQDLLGDDANDEDDDADDDSDDDLGGADQDDEEAAPKKADVSKPKPKAAVADTANKKSSQRRKPGATKPK